MSAERDEASDITSTKNIICDIKNCFKSQEKAEKQIKNLKDRRTCIFARTAQLFADADDVIHVCHRILCCASAAASRSSVALPACSNALNDLAPVSEVTDK